MPQSDMYIRMYLCMYVCNVCMYVCMYVCTHCRHIIAQHFETLDFRATSFSEPVAGEMHEGHVRRMERYMTALEKPGPQFRTPYFFGEESGFPVYFP